MATKFFILFLHLTNNLMIPRMTCNTDLINTYSLNPNTYP